MRHEGMGGIGPLIIAVTPVRLVAETTTGCLLASSANGRQCKSVTSCMWIPKLLSLVHLLA